MVVDIVQVCVCISWNCLIVTVLVRSYSKFGMEACDEALTMYGDLILYDIVYIF